MSVSPCGAESSENAGMSSDNTGENPVRRKPKVSPAMFVRRRLGGPKARPEGVADGYPVEIPDPGISARGGRFSRLHPALLVVAG